MNDINDWVHLLCKGKVTLCPPPTWSKGVSCTIKPFELEPEPDNQPEVHIHYPITTNLHYPRTTPLYPSLERDEESCYDDDGKINCFIQSMRANACYDERGVLWDIRNRLLKERVDLHTIRDMTREDAVYWGIPWGMAKRMKRDVVEFITRSINDKVGWNIIIDLGRGEIH
jgi:hypothetical protein